MFSSIRAFWRHPATRHKPWSSVARYLSINAALRVSKRPVIGEFTDSAKLIVDLRMTQTLGCAYYGFVDYADMLFVCRLLRPGDVMFDIGANVGLYSVLASKLAGASVVAFEPIPANHLRLLDNIGLNHVWDKVRVERVGLGREPGEIQFVEDFADGHTSHAMPTGGSGQSVTCKIVPLDSQCAGGVPDFLKLDVEGFEEEVLAGGKATFADPKLKVVLMEVNGSAVRYGRTDDDLHAAIRAYGFEPYAFEHETNGLVRQPSFGPRTNTLYIRDLEFAQARLKSAPPVRIFGRDN